MATQQQRLKGIERQAQVLELAKAGYTFRQMAAELGIDASTCHRHFQNALKAAVRPAAEEVLDLELERLDAMTKPLWFSAERGNLKSQAAVLRLMERRAAYLGLDAPKRNVLTGADGGPVQLEVTDARERLRAKITELSARAALPKAADA